MSDIQELRMKLDRMACLSGMSCKNIGILYDITEHLDHIEVEGGFARLRELAEADKDGRVVVFPFSPKKNFYYIHDGVVCEARVAYFEVGCAAIFLYAVGEKKPFFVSYIDSNSRKIEQTVFATPEEAAAALAEKGQ